MQIVDAALIRERLLDLHNFNVGPAGELLYTDSWGEQIVVVLKEEDLASSWPRLVRASKIYWPSMDELLAVSELIAAYVDEASSARLSGARSGMCLRDGRIVVVARK